MFNVFLLTSSVKTGLLRKFLRLMTSQSRDVMRSDFFIKCLHWGWMLRYCLHYERFINRRSTLGHVEGYILQWETKFTKQIGVKLHNMIPLNNKNLKIDFGL